MVFKTVLTHKKVVSYFCYFIFYAFGFFLFQTAMEIETAFLSQQEQNSNDRLRLTNMLKQVLCDLNVYKTCTISGRPVYFCDYSNLLLNCCIIIFLNFLLNV